MVLGIFLSLFLSLPSVVVFHYIHRPQFTHFFVDGYFFQFSFLSYRTLCGGASYIARLMVAVAVPGMVFTAWINNYVWLFHRKKNISRQWFTEFFRENWEKR